MNTWDETKRARNLADHGINFAELDDFFPGELRLQSIGLFNGVALFVVWTPRGEDGDIAHLISARKAVSHEEKAWLQRYDKR